MSHYAIKYPRRIHTERVQDLNAIHDSVALHFEGNGGDRLTVVLSQEQVMSMMTMGAGDPARMARDLWVAGHIELDEFERRISDATG